MRPGDYALGYDLYGDNRNSSELEKEKGAVLPEAILIKKSSELEKFLRERGKPRAWKLQSLDMEVDESARGKIDQDKVDDYE